MIKAQLDLEEPDPGQALAMNAGSVASKVTGLTNAEVVVEPWTETVEDTDAEVTRVIEEDPLPEVAEVAEVTLETMIGKKEDVLVARKRVTLERCVPVAEVEETIVSLTEEETTACQQTVATARETAHAEENHREAGHLLK